MTNLFTWRWMWYPWNQLFRLYWLTSIVILAVLTVITNFCWHILLEFLGFILFILELLADLVFFIKLFLFQISLVFQPRCCNCKPLRKTLRSFSQTHFVSRNYLFPSFITLVKSSQLVLQFISFNNSLSISLCCLIVFKKKLFRIKLTWILFSLTLPFRILNLILISRLIKRILRFLRWDLFLYS